MNQKAYLVGAVAIVSVLLAGCVPAPGDGDHADDRAPSASSTPSPHSPSSTPEPDSSASPVLNGTVLTDEDQQQAAIDLGYCVSALPDGRVIAVDPEQPLTAEAREVLQTSLDSIPADPDNPNGSDQAAAAAAARNAADAAMILAAACQPLVLVRLQNIGYPGGPTPNQLRWVATPSSGMELRLPGGGGAVGWGATDADKDALLARVNGWAAEAGNPAVLVQAG